MDSFEHDYASEAGTRHQWTLEQAETQLPPIGATPRSAAVYRHGSLLLKLFAPIDTDPQQPHRRDEIYFVARGDGWFVNGERRHPFSAGDVLFVAAGQAHRFEQFSENLRLWVMFYGPEGGESRES